jgi:hypothetical protein
MAKVRDLLCHVSVETALRPRKCHHNTRKHAIRTGQVCLVIKDASTGAKKNYCGLCAREILNDADVRLSEISKVF